MLNLEWNKSMQPNNVMKVRVLDKINQNNNHPS